MSFSIYSTNSRFLQLLSHQVISVTIIFSLLGNNLYSYVFEHHIRHSSLSPKPQGYLLQLLHPKPPLIVLVSRSIKPKREYTRVQRAFYAFKNIKRICLTAFLYIDQRQPWSKLTRVLTLSLFMRKTFDKKKYLLKLRLSYNLDIQLGQST